jgi:hypothetical protein
VTVLKFIRRIVGWVVRSGNYPVSGKDARWIQRCPRCETWTSHASRHGFATMCLVHCYECGYERAEAGHSAESVKSGIVSAAAHWQKYPVIPYNWHTLSEKERWAILESKTGAGRCVNF